MEHHSSHPLAHVSLERINAIPELLAARVVGQKEVIPVVAQDAQNAALELALPRQPYGSYLALGPTGVRKTELAKTLTYTLYGDPTPTIDHFIRFDMSEYQTQDAISILLGANGKERGKFGLFFDKAQGYGTILFDEIEKAHRRINDLLLQIMDEGRIGLANGEVLNLTRFFCFATSNIGADAMQAARRSTRETIVGVVKRRAMAELRPEIVKRMKTIVFNSLPIDAQNSAGEILLKEELKQHQLRHGIEIKYTKEVAEFLVSRGFDIKGGMRPVKQLTHDLVTRALREPLLQGVKYSGELVIDRETQTLLFKRQSKANEAANSHEEKEPAFV